MSARGSCIQGVEPDKKKIRLQSAKGGKVEPSLTQDIDLEFALMGFPSCFGSVLPHYTCISPF